MDDDDALHLFSLKAFNKDHPVKDYLEMSKHFVKYARSEEHTSELQSPA